MRQLPVNAAAWTEAQFGTSINNLRSANDQNESSITLSGLDDIKDGMEWFDWVDAF